MRKVILLSSIAALSFAAACQKAVPPETELLPQTESVSATAEGGDYSIIYTLSNPSGDAEVKALSEEEWINGFDCSTGGTVKFHVDPNSSTDAREGSVRVEYGDLNFSVPVTQAGLEAPEYDMDTPCSVFLSTYFGDAYETYTHFLMMADSELGTAGTYNPEGTYYIIYLTRYIDEQTATAAFSSGTYTVDPESSYEDWTISAKDSYVVSKNTKYTISSGTLAVSGEGIDNSTFELTLTLDDGSVHHAVYEGPQYGEDYSIDWITDDVDMTATYATANYIDGEGDTDYGNTNLNITLYSSIDEGGWVEVPGYSLILVGNVDFDETGHIVPGTYPISSDAMIEDAFASGYCASFMNSPFPSGTNIRYFYVDNTQQMVGLVTEGEVTISEDGGDYIVECNFVTREGVNIHAYYKGALDVIGAPGTNPYTPYYLTEDYSCEFPLETATMVNVNGMSSSWDYDDAVTWTFNFYQYDENYSYHGDQLSLKIVCPPEYTDEPKEGTYTVATAETKGQAGTVEPGTFEPPVKDNYNVPSYWPTMFRHEEHGEVTFGAAAAGGTMTLTKNDDGTWNVSFDFTDQQQEPRHFRFDWSGAIEIF